MKIRVLPASLLMSLMFLFSLLSAQDKSEDYQLLWRISGNGLSQPSFLFGTMHVTDPKAFGFSDSVLLALEACEAFASEVNMDSAANLMMQSSISERFRGRSLTEYFEKEEFDSLATNFEKETGYDLKNISDKDLWKLRILMDEGKKKEDKMPVFLDAHLYNLARKMGKEIMGLERIEDQMNLIQEGNWDKEGIQKYLRRHMQKESGNRVQDKMLEDYSKGDLENIEMSTEILKLVDKEYYQALISDRNFKMADKMALIAPQKSTFFAVGAGHLPGEEGLIRLMQDKGFTVTLVTPQFTGLAEKFNPSLVDIPWYEFSSERFAYQASFPGQSFQLEEMETLSEGMGDMRMYFDMGTGKMYMLIVGSIPGKIPADRLDDYYKQTINNMKDKVVSGGGVKEILKVKKITYQGTEGRDVLIQISNEWTMLMRLILKNGNIYIMATGPDENLRKSENTQRFFESLTFLKKAEKGWKSIQNEDLGFSTSFPEEFIFRSYHETDPYVGEDFPFRIRYYQSRTVGNKLFLMHLMDYPEGFVIETSDTLFMQEYVEELEGSQAVPIKTMLLKSIEVQGYPGFLWDAITEKPLIAGGPNFYYKFAFIIRNGRIYRQVAICPEGEEEDEEIKDFFDSFRLLEYKNAQPLEAYSFYDEEIEILLPQKPLTEGDTTSPELWGYEGIEQEQYIFSGDSSQAFTYAISTSFFDEYRHEKSLDSALYGFLEVYRSDYDSLLYEKWDTSAGYAFWEIIGKKEGHSSLDRLKVFMSGNKYHSLYAKLHPKDIRDPQVEEVFASFRLKNKDLAWTLLTDKSEKIFSDITSEDSIRRLRAMKALNIYEFNDEHVPGLFACLEKEYAAFDSSYQAELKRSLLSAISEIEMEKTEKIQMLKALFGKLPEGSSLRTEIPEYLVQTDCAEGIEEAKKLYLQYPDIIAYSYTLSSLQWIGNDSLLPAFFPDLYALAKDPEKFLPVAMFALSLADDSAMDVGASSDFREIFTEAAQRAVEGKDLEGVTDYLQEIKVYTILRGFRYLPENESNSKYLRYFLEHAGPDEQMLAATILMEKGEPVDKKILLELAKKPEQKLALMQALEKNDVTSPFSKKEYRQEAITTMMVQADQYDYDTDETVELEAIKLFGKYKVRDLDPEEGQLEEGWMYVYKIKYPGETDWYYVGAGLQPFDKHQYRLKENLLTYFWSNEDNPDINQVIKTQMGENEYFDLIE